MKYYGELTTSLGMEHGGGKECVQVHVYAHVCPAWCLRGAGKGKACVFSSPEPFPAVAQPLCYVQWLSQRTAGNLIQRDPRLFCWSCIFHELSSANHISLQYLQEWIHTKDWKSQVSAMLAKGYGLMKLLQQSKEKETFSRNTPAAAPISLVHREKADSKTSYRTNPWNKEGAEGMSLSTPSPLKAPQ